ncbi:50S ribosomal protein L11 methyltransferase [Ammoniphilus sp. YIM 78166]|uniref:50S ribosomal protein L11 methyltransferase n=1 Tax=Ammoniphilus sp. YIM 78166 TaxID=1644106 RepID=UPI00107050F2|nr:50S ribosomal protein L11 methyltransferase [Ammoniphilus sp. YIM 78166]
MLHEFTITIPYAMADDYIEKLNHAGVYYVSYDTPIEVITTENGYDYQEKPDALVDLKIYAEEGDRPHLPDAYLELIGELFSLEKDQIAYQLLTEDAWQQPFEDIDLGNGWMICLPERAEQYQDAHCIRFDPQVAFGTGLHGTTQDCLRVILEQDFSGLCVADLGTGSGILGIAAALRGASRVLAIDIEPVAREIEYNASQNGVDIQVEQQDLLHGDYVLRKDFDWIFINIGGDEALQLLERHGLLDGFHGKLLVSGLVEWNTAKLESMLSEAGFKGIQRLQSNEWVTFLFAKEPS